VNRPAGATRGDGISWRLHAACADGDISSSSAPAGPLAQIAAAKDHVPLLYRAEPGLVAPVYVMLREHAQIWDLLDSLERAPHRDITGCVPIRELTPRPLDHSRKEEKILYPRADDGGRPAAGLPPTVVTGRQEASPPDAPPPPYPGWLGDSASEPGEPVYRRPPAPHSAGPSCVAGPYRRGDLFRLRLQRRHPGDYPG
jgi:hypothetical protein